MKANLAHTYLLKHDDPDKHLAATPEQVQRLMLYTWEHDAPTSEEIVRDFYRYIEALNAIIDAQGAKVRTLDNRKGRRQSIKGEIGRLPAKMPKVEKARTELFRKLDPKRKRA